MLRAPPFHAPATPRSGLPSLREVFPELEHCFWPTPLEELDLRPPSPYPPEVSSCTLDSPYPQHEFCLSPSPISSPSPSSTSSTLPHSPSPNFVSCSLPPQPCSLPRSFPFSSLPLPKPTSHSLPPLLPHAHPQSTPPSHTFPPRTAHSLPTPSSQPPFTFDVLRPDPRTGALAHIASSRTRATHIPRFPYTQSHKPRKRTGTTAPSALVGPLTLAAARRLQKQAAGHHVCGVCRRAFDRASALTIHARTHSGVRPFVCPESWCRRRFSVESNMRRHARRHFEVPLGTTAID